MAPTMDNLELGHDMYFLEDISWVSRNLIVYLFFFVRHEFSNSYYRINFELRNVTTIITNDHFFPNMVSWRKFPRPLPHEHFSSLILNRYRTKCTR